MTLEQLKTTIAALEDAIANDCNADEADKLNEAIDILQTKYADRSNRDRNG